MTDLQERMGRPCRLRQRDQSFVRITVGPSIRVCITLAMVLLLTSNMAAARAVQMTESNPRAETIIHGDHAEYVVRFDGPVNHDASRLEIVQDGQVVRALRPSTNAAVDVLFAEGPVPAPGRYELRWTAISADGERSSGEVPFTVGP